MNAPTKRLGRGLGSLIAGGGPESLSTPTPQPLNTALEQAEPKEEPIIENTPDTQITSGTSSQLQELPLNRVVPNPHQPRKVINPDAVKELAASISSEGLLQPIVVRPTSDGYELIAGERRWRAHQYLEKSTILARILDATDLSSASLSLIENLQREELNPIEEAMGYQSLVSDFNLTQQQVAERMGKSRAHITNLLRLLNLDTELKRLLADGELSVGHAKVLLGIEDPTQRVKIGQQAVLEGWTVRQCENVVSCRAVAVGTPVLKKSSSNVQFEDLSISLASKTARKVKIKANSQMSGTIAFSFKSENDLHILLSQLNLS